MADNYVPEQMAKTISQQFINKQALSIKDAAFVSGRTEKNAHLTTRTATFQQALFYNLPYHVVIEAQKKMIHATVCKEINWRNQITEDEVRAACKAQDWHILSLQVDQDDNIWTLLLMPNYEFIDRSLDKYYKLIGAYAPEKVEIGQTNLADLPDNELLQLVKEANALDVEPLPQPEAETAKIEPPKN